MKNYFKRTEFYKQWRVTPPNKVLLKIDNHIRILNEVRGKLDTSITISKYSGYRPRSYDIGKGRSGNSQHNYEGLGAVDITCRKDKLSLLFELLQESEYTRVCLYPDNLFIHCDLKEIVGKQQVFLCLDGKWERQGTI